MLNIGLCGAVIIVANYFCLLSGRYTIKTPMYLFLNTLGGVLLTVYALQIQSLPFAFVNGVFAIGSFVKWVQRTFYR